MSAVRHVSLLGLAAILTAGGASSAWSKALLGEPEVDRASDQYDGLWCPAEQIQMYDGTFTADGPEATLVFVATNHFLGNWRRERIDNVVVVPLADYGAHKHLPDPALAAAYNCIEPAKNYFHFSDVPPANIVFLEKFAAGIPPGWDMTDGAYNEPASSALNAFALPIDATGGSLGLGLDAVPSAEATTEITFAGLTAGQQYVVTTWTGCIDASVGHDLLIQVYGTAFFSLAGWQPVDVGQGRGLAWGDPDWDGDLDVYVANLNSPSKFWRNDGGSFSDATVSAGVSLNAPASAVAWVDIDNDSDLDLHIGSGGQDRYFRNQGNGTFVNATTGPIGDTRQNTCLDWGDYDRDGDVDVFLGNIETDALLRNDGGNFVDVASGSLLGSGSPVGCSWVDFDDDGDLDLFVTYSQQANELFVNTGGAFVKSTPAILATPQNGTSAAWADYDNDADLDVYLTALGGENMLCRNDGNGQFANATPRIMADTGNGIESIWGDSDNDGLLDLYLIKANQPNILFRNLGAGNFAVRNTGTVENTGLAAGAAWGDADEDGDLDLYVANANGVTGGLPDVYYLNEFGDGAHWLEIDLRGTISNRFGVGAKVFVTSGSTTQMREVGGESGLRSQQSLTADFGLGTASLANALRVEWPSGIVQTFANIPANQRITILEGAGATAAAPAAIAAASGIVLRPNVPNPFRESTSIGYALPAPGEIEMRVFDVAGRVVKVLENGPKGSGDHTVEWNGRDETGTPVAPGIYFYELRAGAEAQTKKMVRITE